MKKQIRIHTVDQKVITGTSVGYQMYNPEFWGQLFDNTLLYVTLKTANGTHTISGAHIVSVEIKETE